MLNEQKLFENNYSIFYCVLKIYKKQTYNFTLLLCIHSEYLQKVQYVINNNNNINVYNIYKWSRKSLSCTVQLGLV